MRSSLLLCACLAACGAPAPAWHVSGGQLRAPDGRAAILHGANVTGEQKLAPYLDPQTVAADYSSLRSVWGMNAARFVMTWSALEPSRGNYDEAYLNGVADRLAWARDAGLLVILDMHQDLYGEGFSGGDGAPRWTCDESHYQAFKPNPDYWALSYLDPNVQACFDHFYTDEDTRSRFVSAWRHVAERFAGEPSVIGFDILNEPHWGSYPITAFEHDRLQPLYEQVIASVRIAAPHWLAFAEPASSRNLGFSTGLRAFAAKDVVYAPHEYDAQAESSGNFDPTHRATIIDNEHRLRDEANALSAALWIGEYGGIAASANIGDYMAAVLDGASAAVASTMYWDYGQGGYGMRAAGDSPVPSLLNVLVRPSPEYVAGAPLDWSWDAQSATFTLHLHPDGTLAVPTEIAIPARLYPNGYAVDCAGCSIVKASDRVDVTGAPSTIVIHPSL